MPKHRNAPKPLTFLPILATTIAAVSLSTVGHAVTVDASGQSLSFNEGKVNGAGTLLTQSDGSSAVDIGQDLTLNEYVDYYNVINIGGQQIDARVTILSLVDQEGTGGTLNQLEYVDEGDSTAGENAYINLQLDPKVGQGNSYAELKIEFFTDLASSPQAATIRNLKMSTYDVDDYQYVELNNFDSYAVSTNSTLDVSKVRGTYTRFIDTLGYSIGSPDSQTSARATVTFNSVSEFTFRVGQDVPAGVTEDGSATYILDFSVGKSWTVGGVSLEGAQIVAPSAVVPVSVVSDRLPRLDQTETLFVSPGGQLVLTGDRLHCTTAITIAGQPASFVYSVLPIADGRSQLSISLPQLAPGFHSLSMDSCGGPVTYDRFVSVSKPPVMIEGRFSTGMEQGMKIKEIRRWVLEHRSDYNSVKCISNTRVEAQERARQFANDICKQVLGLLASPKSGEVEVRDKTTHIAVWYRLFLFNK